MYSNCKVLLEVQAALSGDFNADGSVDAADYVVWRKGLNSVYTLDDYHVWRAHYGEAVSGTGSGSTSSSHSEVPEPASIVLATLTVSLTLFLLRRCRDKNLHSTVYLRQSRYSR